MYINWTVSVVYTFFIHVFVSLRRDIYLFQYWILTEQFERPLNVNVLYALSIEACYAFSCGDTEHMYYKSS